MISCIGTYGWSGGALKHLREFAGKNDWKLIEPVVEAKCSPTEEDLNKCCQLGKNMVQHL